MRTRELLAAMGIVGVCVLTGCSSDAGANAAASSTAPTSDSVATGTPAAATSSALLGRGGRVPDEWPAAAVLEHGATVWAVYLATGPAGDPALAEAAEYLEARGYSTSADRELGCDGGAAEALGRDPQDRAVAVYFDWRADAGDYLTLSSSNGKQDAGPLVEMLRVTVTCTP